MSQLFPTQGNMGPAAEQQQTEHSETENKDTELPHHHCSRSSMNGLLCGGGCLLLALQLVTGQLVGNVSGKWLENGSNTLVELCHFLAQVERLQVGSPLPSQVTHLQSTGSIDSPLLHWLARQANHSECGIARHNIPIGNRSRLSQVEMRSLSNLKSRLVLLECSTDQQVGLSGCAQVLLQLCAAHQQDQAVARRLFTLVLLYEHESTSSVASQLVHTLLHNSVTSKVHAAILVYRLNQAQSKFNFERVHFVRPLKNSCLVGQDHLESKQFDRHILARHLLAIDQLTERNIPCHLHNSKLTAVVTKSFFCEFSTNDEGEIQFNPSLELNAFKVLSEKYHFTYGAIDANGSYGRREGNVWLGSIGYLVNQTADLALCDLIYTYDRSVVVDFTFPYDMEPISFLTKKPGFRVRKWAFFFALPTDIWAISFITLLVLTAILHIAIRIQGMVTESKPHQHNHSPLMLLLSIFFQQSLSHRAMHGLDNFEIRFIIIMWSFAALIIMRCYSGIFYSSITVPEAMPPIDSVAEVQQTAVQDTGLVFTSRYLYDMAMAAKCCPGTFDHDLGQHVRRNPYLVAQQKTNFETRIDTLQNYAWSKSKPLLFITSRSILMIFSQYITYSLHVSEATFMLDALGIAHLKDALYGPFFSETILRMLETGLIDKWFRDTLLEHEHRAFLRRQMRQQQKGKSAISSPDKSKSSTTGSSSSSSKTMAEQEAENIHNFRIDELESVFVLYLVGNGLAALAFLLQFTHKHATTIASAGHSARSDSCPKVPPKHLNNAFA